MRDSILHLADLHLGAPAAPQVEELDAGLAAELRRSRDGLLGRLAAWIARPESRVGLVLIAGDLFHGYRPPEEVEQAARTALAQMAACVPVVTVPGNHDEYSYAECVYRRGTWPGRLATSPEPAEVWRGELDGGTQLSVVAATYEAGKVPPGGTVRFPPVDPHLVGVALVHGTMDEYYPGLADRCFRIGHAQAAEAGYRYLAAGHIHAAGQWTSGDCLAVYPGPPVGPSPADRGSGSLVLGEFPEGRARCRRIDDPALLGWRWWFERVRVEPGETPEQVAERLWPALPAEDRQLSVVELAGSINSEDFDRQLQQAILARGRKIVVEAAGAIWAPPPDLATLRDEQTLSGEYVRMWEAWREAERPDETHAARVLHEGLAALRRRG